MLCRPRRRRRIAAMRIGDIITCIMSAITGGRFIM
jgi:hypothetical protein